ncbi:MAG TPA: hypothetical protein VI542_33225, partial [Candidatus Tectomicrobia bacterium]
MTWLIDVLEEITHALQHRGWGSIAFPSWGVNGAPTVCYNPIQYQYIPGGDGAWSGENTTVPLAPHQVRWRHRQMP